MTIAMQFFIINTWKPLSGKSVLKRDQGVFVMTFVRQWALLYTNPSYTCIILDCKMRQLPTDVFILVSRVDRDWLYIFKTAYMSGISQSNIYPSNTQFISFGLPIQTKKTKTPVWWCCEVSWDHEICFSLGFFSLFLRQNCLQTRSWI